MVKQLFLRPEIFVYLAFGVFTTLFFLLAIAGNAAPRDGLFGYYARVHEARIVWTLFLVAIGLLVHASVLWFQAIRKGSDPTVLLSRATLSYFFSQAVIFLRNIVFFGIPFVLAFYSLSSALGQLNLFNANRLKDELLFRWDTLVAGTFPPLSFASLQYPTWFIEAVQFSFMNLVPAVTIFGAYLFVAHHKLFREAGGAFFAGFLLLFAGWFLFPVLSPHDRFIDNVYDLPVPPAVQQYVEEYRPQVGVAAFLEKMRESKEGLAALPTSTFPSAHVAWGTFLAYYAWRLQRWLLAFALPFVALSSIGTFLFAQHYFVDLPAGVAVALVSVAAAHWLARASNRYGLRARIPAEA